MHYQTRWWARVALDSQRPRHEMTERRLVWPEQQVARRLVDRLLAEIQTGTLEQTYLSLLPSWLHVAAGRSVAAAENLVVVTALYVITGPARLGSRSAGLADPN